MTTLDTPCRAWQGPTVKGGYGYVTREGRLWLIHRWVWKLVTGQDPGELHVLHHCDNPPCFRFDHLFLGTRSDNMRDAQAKGRIPTKDARTRCRHGHELTPENTYTYPHTGYRECRRCRRGDR